MMNSVRFSVTMIALLSVGYEARADGECATTIDCAKQMVASVAALHGTDEALAARIKTLTEDLVAATKAYEQADAALQDTLTRMVNQRINALARHRDILPREGDVVGRTCPAGQVMVGAKYGYAHSGANAGALYHGIWPICRALR